MAFHIIFRTPDRVHRFVREVCPYETLRRARRIEAQGGESVGIRTHVMGSTMSIDAFCRDYDWVNDNRANPDAGPPVRPRSVYRSGQP